MTKESTPCPPASSRPCGAPAPPADPSTTNPVRRRDIPVWVSLLASALGGFGIGTTEFATMGVLPEIAGDLGASIPSAVT